MSELTSEELRAKATELGIKFTKNTSDDTLIAKIDTVEAETRRAREGSISRKEGRALKRVRIMPLNPLEAKLPAKWFILANSLYTLKKAVLFNKDIFLEKAMINHIKQLKFLQIESNADTADTKHPTPNKSISPAYSVVELPDLTPAQLEALKKDKAMRDAAIKD